MTMRNIGDKVWIARLKHRIFRETCPDCLGTKAVTLLLENGERHQLECMMCYPGGFSPANGWIEKTQYQPTADQCTINEMDVKTDKTTYRFFGWSCDEVFDSEAEAMLAAEKLRKESEDYDHHQFVWKKEECKRTWASNCSYYRKQIKDAKRDLAYAEARLNVCKAKAKEPIAEEASK